MIFTLDGNWPEFPKFIISQLHWDGVTSKIAFVNPAWVPRGDPPCSDPPRGPPCCFLPFPDPPCHPFVSLSNSIALLASQTALSEQEAPATRAPA